MKDIVDEFMIYIANMKYLYLKKLRTIEAFDEKTGRDIDL
jgi:hypothetical protein